MADYAIGDVQGCYRQMMELLDLIDYCPNRDHLWFLGDVVNRGPDSLAVLRFLSQTANSHVTLGNHDLHLLAVHRECSPIGDKDSFTDVLTAPDRDELCDYLLRQPLVSAHMGYLMAHAGIAPQWSEAQALALSREMESVLQGEQSNAYFREMYGDEPSLWDDNLSGVRRWRLITNYCTRMRYCDRDGRLNLDYKLKPKHAPLDCYPWFDVPSSQPRFSILLFGHWAALEGLEREGLYGLDTGCVWGGALTALRLQDRQIFRIRCETR